ncbi:hypothetical protein JCM10213_000633 [Rhodosporidiobolus nylandii]
MAHQQLKQLIHAANALLGLAAPPSAPSLTRPKPSLTSVLAARLDAYHAVLSSGSPSSSVLTGSADAQSEGALQRATAAAALELLEQLAAVARLPPSEGSSTAGSSARKEAPPPPMFGARDIKVLGMLAGVVGRWGVAADSEEGPPPSAGGPGLAKGKEAKITELEDGEEEEEPAVKRARLADTVRRILVFLSLHSEEAATQPRQDGEKQFLDTVVPQLLAPLVAALVQLGREDAWAREGMGRVFRSNPPTAVLSLLLQLLSTSRAPPTRGALTALLTSQLLRPGGVRSLLIVVVGTGSAAGAGDEVDTRKLEMVRRLMSATPGGVGREGVQAHFTNLTGQLLSILRSAALSSVSSTLSSVSSSTSKGKSTATFAAPAAGANVPPSILRAAAYVLAHFLVEPVGASAVGDFARPSLLRELHGPLLHVAYPSSSKGGDESTLLDAESLYTHLTVLSLLSLYAPPLPGFLSSLISPLLPPLFSLLAHLSQPPLIVAAPSPSADAHKRGTSDEAHALLGTLAKGERVEEAVKAVARAVESWEKGEEFGAPAEGGRAAELMGLGGAVEGEQRRPQWAWGEDGAPLLSFSSSPSPPGSPLLDNDGDEPSLEALQLRVNPEVLVEWLKDVDRRELSAGLFLRWLDEVRVLQSLGEQGGVEGAKRAILRLQLILKMVETLGSSILTSPDEIIAFVAHALSSAPAEPDANGDREEDEKVEEDEEAEQLGLGTGLGKDEMVVTGITLLLAVLEANESLSPSTSPLLAAISAQLSLLASSSSSPIIAPLAREARMVLSLRSATSSFDASTSSSTAPGDPEDPLQKSRETYREALKLLQDPLLPVRAQGLHLLRTLVLDKETALLSTDPALLPAVLDVFASAIEEEDSFLYLNAVQGLSSLVDVFGKQVVGRLMEVYTGARRDERRVRDVGTGEKGRREIDKRLRVGEALVQVVQRAGEALAVMVDILLPPLLLTLRQSSLPIPLRASALTILATCVETAPSALVPHAELLADACVSLLQVESVPLAPKPRATTAFAEEKKPAAKRDNGKGKGVLIEEVSSSSSEDEADEPAPPSLGKDGRPRRPEELADPTTTHSKHPTLRRAALVFLGSLVRTLARQAAEQQEQQAATALRAPVSEGLLGGRLRMPGERLVGGALIQERRPATERTAGMIGAETLVKARRVLRYVKETDEDGLVRHQAGEVLEELEE